MLSLIFSSLFLLLAYGSVNIYITKRLHRWLKPFCKLKYWLFATLYAIPASSVWFYFFLQSLSTNLGIAAPVWLRTAVIWVGSVWMGVFLYLLASLLLLDAVLLVLRLSKRSEKACQRVRFWGTLAALELVLLLVVYGTAHAANIQTASYEVKVNKPMTKELNVVLISDLHLGAAGSERNLENAVKRINQIEPDVVCIAGDLFNDDFNSLYDPARVSELLRSIHAKYGVYACLGNHDGVNRFEDMLQLLRDGNVTLLNDAYTVVEDRFVIVGRLDARAIGDFDGLERAELAEILDPAAFDLPVIVMDHNPARINEYDGSTDLILSGHTHKGQLFPANILTYLMYDVHYGYYQKDADSPQVVVTSGVGYWGMPMRIGTDCEIAQITVKGANG
ncbi:MAG: metallophosphoesterase [Clostridia bacterium]|nr:metallophosphoesterase [Clostridia bacterium]